MHKPQDNNSLMNFLKESRALKEAEYEVVDDELVTITEPVEDGEELEAHPGEEIEPIIDPELGLDSDIDEEEVKNKSYIGKKVSVCEVCGTVFFADTDNVEELECPVCYTSGDDLTIVGVVKPADEETDEDEEEMTDDDFGPDIDELDSPEITDTEDIDVELEDELLEENKKRRVSGRRNRRLSEMSNMEKLKRAYPELNISNLPEGRKKKVKNRKMLEQRQYREYTYPYQVESHDYWEDEPDNVIWDDPTHADDNYYGWKLITSEALVTQNYDEDAGKYYEVSWAGADDYYEVSTLKEAKELVRKYYEAYEDLYRNFKWIKATPSLTTESNKRRVSGRKNILESDENEELDWHWDWEEHPLQDLHNEAMDRLDIWPEPSIQGDQGGMAYYTNKGDDTFAWFDYQDEVQFMNDLTDSYTDIESNREEIIQEIIQFIVSKKDDLYESRINRKRRVRGRRNGRSSEMSNMEKLQRAYPDYDLLNKVHENQESDQGRIDTAQLSKEAKKVIEDSIWDSYEYGTGPHEDDIYYILDELDELGIPYKVDQVKKYWQEFYDSNEYR